MIDSPVVKPEAKERPIKKRRGWLAGLLAAVCPGLGHLYVGRPMVAVFFVFVAPMVFGALIVAGAFNPGMLYPLTLSGIMLYVSIWTGQLVWASLMARRAGADYRLRWFNRILVYIGFFVASTVAINLLGRRIRHSIIEPFEIPSSAMVPTLLPGDQVFVVKVGAAGSWAHGDLIVYPVPDAKPSSGDFDKTVFIKRVVATGGDTVAVDDRQVIVNGTPNQQHPCAASGFTYSDSEAGSSQARSITASCLEETTAEKKSYSVIHMPSFDGNRQSFGPATLDHNQVFVMGDNRDNSMDSRFTGPIARDGVIGRAVVVWFSFSLADGVRWSRMGQRL